MLERERKGVGGQEAKKTRERKGKTSVVVVAHEKPQPVVCLALVCLLCGVCVWHQLFVSEDGVVSDGKHHCGSVADAVCVCHVVCVCEWGDGVGGGGCGMVWSTHSTPWCVWWCMWRVCVWQWCMHQVPCVCV